MADSDQYDFERGRKRVLPRQPSSADSGRRTLDVIEGLPDDWDPRFIPDPDALETAALKAMHEVRAFLLMHRDDPLSVAEHLEWLSGLVQAAVTVKGRHRAKAVGLGLALTREYWIKANMLGQWQGFLLNLLSCTRDIGDPILEAEIYRAWGICLQVQGGQPKAERALESALEIASETLRPDIALLARLELFNARALRMLEGPARAEADEILAAARRMNYTYLIGRVHLSLARMYAAWLNHAQAFHHVQQAFVIFVQQGYLDIAGQALVMMLGSLQAGFVGSERYRQQLLTFLESHPIYLNDLTVHSMFYRNQAVYWYRREEYETARHYCVHAYRLARAAFYPPNREYSRHMLGLIHLKRHKWSAARYYLSTAAEHFRALELMASMISAKHALSYIPFEQQDYATALVQLSELLDEAEHVLDAEAFSNIRPDIEEDIEEARRRLG